MSVNMLTCLTKHFGLILTKNDSSLNMTAQGKNKQGEIAPERELCKQEAGFPSKLK